MSEFRRVGAGTPWCTAGDSSSSLQAPGLPWLLSFQSLGMAKNLYQLLSKAHEQP